MRLLRANVALNEFGWVELRQAALGERPGRATLYSFGPGAGVNSFAPAVLEGSQSEEVEVMTLDSIANDAPVRLIKLDIEGAEVHALRGAENLLKRVQPDFIIELEPEHLKRQGSSVKELRSLFLEADYEPFQIEPGPHFSPLLDWSRPVGSPDIVVRPRQRRLSARP